ncbi:uncharacterized protein LOC133318463 [Gastrolobium bilobum]|uniref:uncharacterized protein LOC133318463 n=1 Tax=Gastrolobium bilobum TaxID=150636 RepID=UPI002AB074B2|nr:uncharacterized protein LOC133318463 [Gastrolobium bilobum]
MNKLLEFGRKAMFYVRVLSGYEERRIRSFRLQLEERVKQAQERKAALNKVPEQIILSDVRRMVEEMQALNKKLEETETAIEEYFKPLDKEAEIIMKMQLQGEEKTSEMMMKALEQQVDNIETNQKEAEILMKMGVGEEEQTLKEMMKAMQQQLLLEKADAENTDSVHQVDNSHINPIIASTVTPKES